jgi:hypothetical protein
MKSRTLLRAARLSVAAGIALAALGAPAAQATSLLPTTVSLTSSANPVVAGATVTYTATVIPAISGGTVDVWDNGYAIAGCAALPVVDGVASCTVPASSDAGLHYIHPMYSGSSPYGPSSSMYFLKVSQVTTTVVTAAPKLADPGEAMTYKSVTMPRPVEILLGSCAGGCGGPVPVELVDFSVDGEPIAACQDRPVDNATGVATCKSAVAPAAGGRHVVTADYSAAADGYQVPSSGSDDFAVKAPGISLSAGALDFGSATVGATVARDVTVTNTGTRALTLSGVTAGGAFSVASSTCGATLDADASCTVTAAFTPAAAGAASATLTISSDAGAPGVALSGTGVAAPSTATPPPTGATLPPNAKTTFTASTPSGNGPSTVTVPLRCPAGIACTLDGTVVISTDDLVKRKTARAAARDTQTVARFSGVRVAPGKVREIKLKLSPAFVKKAQKRGVRFIHAVLTVNTTFTDGTKATRQEQVAIRIPKAVAKKKAATRAPRFTG